MANTKQEFDVKPWKWHLKSLWGFQERYMEHRLRVSKHSLPFKSGVLEHLVPSEIDFQSVVTMIGDHETKLTELAQQMKRPYAASIIFAPFDSATIS